MVKHTKNKRNEYTIYELLTIISIIGMFIGIGIIYKSHLEDINIDSVRLKKAEDIALSLEKYHLLNNTYPSCNTMSESQENISEILININPKTLSDENNDKIILPDCKDINVNNSNNKVSYIGNRLCVENKSLDCQSFTLKYYKQSTGKIISINSESR